MDRRVAGRLTAVTFRPLQGAAVVGNDKSRQRLRPLGCPASPLHGKEGWKALQVGNRANEADVVQSAASACLATMTLCGCVVIFRLCPVRLCPISPDRRPGSSAFRSAFDCGRAGSPCRAAVAALWNEAAGRARKWLANLSPSFPLHGSRTARAQKALIALGSSGKAGGFSGAVRVAVGRRPAWL